MELANQLVEVEKIARKQLIKIFTEIGFVDGASLSEEKLKKEQKPIFWEEILDVEIASKKPFYIVYNFRELTNNTYSDNKLAITYITININIFSTKDFSSQDTYNIRAQLENAFKNEKNIEYFRYLTKFYDTNINLNQISYTAKMGCRLYE